MRSSNGPAWSHGSEYVCCQWLESMIAPACAKRVASENVMLFRNQPRDAAAARTTSQTAAHAGQSRPASASWIEVDLCGLDITAEVHQRLDRFGDECGRLACVRELYGPGRRAVTAFGGKTSVSTTHSAP